MERIDQGNVTQGTIDFVMPFGLGETIGRLRDCLVQGEPVPRDLLDYINGAMGLMIPDELMQRTWRVDQMDWRANPVRVRVALSSIS